jgi:uncharacterized protein YhaN
MRLNRLDLVRYGKFTERSLDFGAVRPGKADFHLVHGPNEAGKSTLFSAYLDLLFGIEKTSAYGFLHPYPVMRVGGSLTIGDVQHEAYRLKRNQASLVGADDRALADGLFAGVLGGMDRAAYRMMFSLDDDSIEKGGDDILRSEGELGSMLFSASSGLSDIASGLAAMKSEADEFYRPQGRKHGLSTLKAEIESLKEERKALDIAARDYGVLVRERDLAAERYEAAVQARSEVRGLLDALERKLAALPHLRRLRELRERLADFDLGETPPPGWPALVVQLSREEAELFARAGRIDGERSGRQLELSAIEDDPAVLALEADVAALTGSALEARFRTATMDMASRVADRDRLTGEIEERLAALGLPRDTDPTRMMLAPGIADRLSAHFSRRSGLAERLSGAERELADANRALEKAEEAAPSLTDEPVDEGAAAKLSTILRTVRSGDLIGRWRAARRAVALAEQEFEAERYRLAPWNGDAQSLRASNGPTAAARAALRARLDTLADSRRRIEDQSADMSVENATRRASLESLLQTAGLAGADEAQALRNAREAAWRLHREKLDAPSAEAFEAAMRHDDFSVEARLANADRLSEIRLVEKSLAEAAARAAALASEAARLDAQRELALADVRGMAKGLGLPEDTALDGIDAWMETRDTAMDALSVLEKSRVEADLVEWDVNEIRGRVDLLLGSPQGDPDPLDELLQRAEDRLALLRDRQFTGQAAAENLARARTNVDERRVAAEDARSALADWQAAWDRSIAGTWLAGPQAPNEPDRLGVLLPALLGLSQRVESRNDFDHRIAAMRRDQEDYARFAGGLAEKLSMPFDPADPIGSVAAVSRRLDAARSSAARRKDIEAVLLRLQDDDATLAERRAVLDARKSEILGFLGCETLGEAETILAAHVRRTETLDLADAAGRDLARQLLTETADEAESLLATVDEPQLNGERTDYRARLEELDREVQELHSTRGKASDALARVAGGDSGAVLEERRRTALLEIAEKSRRYLAARAGILAAEQALRLYRERHRSAMMERASRTFSMISAGEYTGLSTMVEKESELLIANAAAGGSKLARDLSKGTRFQLYLALRVAGYHEIAANREIMPFIADDIMETFDDGRALNALRVMAGMAESGQVIYLTHHQHLRDLAKEACPDVTIHEL